MTFLDDYSSALEARPLLTKALTTGFLMIIGDIGSQKIEKYMAKKNGGKV